MTCIHTNSMKNHKNKTIWFICKIIQKNYFFPLSVCMKGWEMLVFRKFLRKFKWVIPCDTENRISSTKSSRPDLISSSKFLHDFNYSSAYCKFSEYWIWPFNSKLKQYTLLQMNLFSIVSYEFADEASTSCTYLL